MYFLSDEVRKKKRQANMLGASLFCAFIVCLIYFDENIVCQKRNRLQVPTKQASLALEAGFVGT